MTCSSISSERVAVAILVAVLSLMPGSSRATDFQTPITVEDSALDLELAAATTSSDGTDTWLVVTGHARGMPGQKATVRLVHLRAGTVQTSTDIAPAMSLASLPGGALPAGRRAVKGVVRSDDGGALVGLAEAGKPGVLLAFTPEGKARGSNGAVGVKSKPGVEMDILTRFADGRLLMIGRQESHPVLMELGPDGSIGRDWVLPQGKATLLARAASGSDGSLFMVGRGGESTRSMWLWLCALSPAREITAESTVDGNNGDLARLADGGFALVYDEAADASYDVFVKILGPDLKERSVKQVLKGQLFPSGYRIAPVPSGGFIVAGGKDRGLWIARYDSSGRELWAESRTPVPPDIEMVSSVELLARGDTFVVPYTAYVVKGREQRQIVRILTFTTG